MKTLKTLLLKQKAQNNSYSELMIIGLGNPGSKYEQTRHNVGFDLIELLSGQLNLFLKKPLFKNYRYASTFLGNRRVHLVEPLTFMNRSGNILPALVSKYSLKPENIIIVTDNMDLPPGRCRMKPGGSSAGHNGLKSIIQYLDTGKFFRLYVGIGRPSKDLSVVDHVLGVFPSEDYSLVQNAIVQAVKSIIAQSDAPVEQLLNEINSRKN
ncbi:MULTISPECIES: aminoacyl-tRNA hydrolase [unclassified Oceanispirochaeta]|uniref:aminoacyl-tRNA hydrolase n=1 Tax=unclassified Oceanispirochaeta TaxID=2635722 RepID=UPI0011C039E2|nr:aminoacyl-tRNA hydrolase [Oceanispirochaeta sp. M1]MBF9018102.1 aminoacyl-tRNA hydrolase [Oceanispirochaeta sp. M2]NPD74566.1 aminoacyl-tRNA hydrolase [Oceanispirochaeta sp. M1]